ncbi:MULTISPECIES: M48 family metallopeptidase [unclassified Arsukibacterium]|uniref:M48 family metallopeptidase n=1 Tax=unclassified Arsukibacterium TaxID=2635278 RepID=UPI000C3D9EDB|nr:MULTISPECIES: SprT family zinc-dependent metalloprotease [unclassified Arsukibacterium]MAA94758.1 hypothetical protein [Rheinheimera sp.]MBM33884.1 hypothetical protein [Rheinheimera sp.]HAW93745.1 hypothetical protein [Candidatus Azambacteria bacterium]
MRVDYKIVYSRRRTLAIVIRHGLVTVRAPLGCKIKHIEHLIQTKQPWIQRHLSHQQSQPAALSWQQRGTLLFKGTLLNVVCSRAAKSNISVVGHNLLIEVSDRVASVNLSAWQNQLFSQWLKTQANMVFQPRLSSWAQTMDISFRELKLGQWQRRWGYCDSNGVIGLNWRLIMAPEWVSDYVMVHELAHREVMDHSAAFWQIIDRYVPEYPQAQAWLSYYQQQLVK